MSANLVEHAFGGPWTELKLDVVRKYLSFYTGALKNQPFKKWYIDGFAGSGSRTVRRPGQSALPLFGLDAEEDATEEIAGSAKLALTTQIPFDHHIFIEQDQERYAALAQLAEDSDRSTRVTQAEANAEIRAICATTPWMRWPGIRAVLFLDPYGLTVEWATLEAIARTAAIDVWYLFPISGVCRQAARDLAAVDLHKSAALTRVLGTEEWKTVFYRDYIQPKFDFDEVPLRAADARQMEAWVKGRLGNLFAECSDPLPLPIDVGPQKFSLFFAVSNPAAAALAMRAANHILKVGRSR